MVWRWSRDPAGEITSACTGCGRRITGLPEAALLREQRAHTRELCEADRDTLAQGLDWISQRSAKAQILIARGEV